jgi:ribonuclease III
MKPENIASIEERLGYTFKNKSILIRALTRKAFASEQKQKGRNCEDQEVYRILGDAVLKAILVEMLIEEGCETRETITNKKIDLEKRENLGTMLREMEIAPFIRFGAGEQKQRIFTQSSVLGETFEALVAAVHVDGGRYEATRRFVFNLFTKPVSEQPTAQALKQDLELDTMSKMWRLHNECDTCFQSDLCASMMACYFDITGND